MVSNFRVALARVSALAVILALFLGSGSNAAADIMESEANDLSPQTIISISNDEIRKIAKEAYKYGYPMVGNYRNIYSFIFPPRFEQRQPLFNRIDHQKELIGPDDKQVVTPNSDTLYSYLPLDLRDGPVVLTLPNLSVVGGDSNRYYSVQLVDLYTHNFDYLGSRTTGNNGGIFLVVGPNWDGKIPDNIKIARDKIFPCESEIALALYRTQVFNQDDLDTIVSEIQPRYTAQPLSRFPGNGSLSVKSMGNPDAWPVPPDNTEIERPVVFEYINFLLDLAPPHPTELGLMKEFEKINVGRGLVFDAQTLPLDQRMAIRLGIRDALREKDALIGSKGGVGSGDFFGQRCFLKNNYLYRFAGAKVGIYGNDREEAYYPLYDRAIDSGDEEVELDGSDGASYTLTFAKDDQTGSPKYPPADAFWSLTMYGEDQFLVDNIADRYLLNSSMEDDFQLNGDGSVTFYIQHEPPAETVQGYQYHPNWLPAPDGKFFMVMRLYLPASEVLEGSWTQPPIMRSN